MNKIFWGLSDRDPRPVYWNKIKGGQRLTVWANRVGLPCGAYVGGERICVGGVHGVCVWDMCGMFVG